MTYSLAVTLVTGVGLLGCATFVVGYWYVTGGAWLREEAGRFFMSLTTTIGALLALVLVGQLLRNDPLEWTPMRALSLTIYVGFVAILWWPLRLLVLAQREKHR